ncbi:MAG: DUF6056 family protein [Muribaculaceae bacterium]
MMTHISEKTGRRVIFAALALMAVCVFVAMNAFTYTGDDLSYKVWWQAFADRRGIVLGYPAFVMHHWVTTNGRLANGLTPVLLAWLPKWLVDALLGIAFAALIVMILKSVDWGRGGRFTAKSLLTALVVFTLPWWDSLLLYDCWLNYPLAALFALASVYSMSRDHRKGITVLLGVFAFVAGAMHEACGVALSAGILAYRLMHKREIGKSRKAIGLAFMAGALFVVSSPGIWTRFGHPMFEPRGTAETLLTSDFYSIALAAVCAVMACFSGGRRRLAELIRTRWTIFAAAALVSSLFCAVSGIIGRTGFFAQIFSLISLFGMFPYSRLRLKPRTGAAIGVVILAVTCVQMILFAVWEHRLGAELREVIEKYKASPDGIVFADYTRDDEVPAFLLNKVRGVPDADDAWILRSIAWYYGDTDSRPLKILPTGVRGIDPGAMTEPLRLGRYVITKTLPADTYSIDVYDYMPLLAVRIDGTEYMVTPFTLRGTTLYKLEPRYVDWGD